MWQWECKLEIGHHGWYNGYNRKVYRKNKYDYEKADTKAKEEITKRLEKFKNEPSYAFDFYYKKLVSQWNNPTFQGLWINDIRKNLNSKPFYVRDVLGKTPLNESLNQYMNILQTIILFGALMYIIIDYKKINGKQLFFITIFIGGFLFHILWEAKGQYTITYFLLLIPYCIKGYDILSEKINVKIKEKSHDR